MLRSLLISALIFSSSAERAATAATIESSDARAVSSAFREEFRTAYGSVLWTMMVLRWCNERWDRPKETAAAEARFKAISALAIRRDLKRQMNQAARDNARAMAVMRLDTRCNGGFNRSHAGTQRALSKAEHLLRNRRRS